MISKRISLFGILAGAAVVSGVLAGCGGSSASTQGNTPFVPITGGVTGTTSGTSTQTVPASTTPQQVQVTLPDGTSEMGTLPAGQSVNSGDSVGVIPPNQPVIAGITYAGPKRAATPSDLFVDGVDSGIQINPDTSIPVILILPHGQHTLSETGPFNINTGGQTLTVGKFIWLIQVHSDGIVSIPTSVNGRLPANGGSTANGSLVTVNLVGDFVLHRGTLIIKWPGVTKTQERTFNKKTILGLSVGQATFNDPLSDPTDAIPASGVDSVELDIIPPAQ